MDSINKKPDNPDDDFLSMKGIVRIVCNGIRKVFQYIYKIENMRKYQAYLSKEIVNMRLPSAKVTNNLLFYTKSYLLFCGTIR